MKTVEKSGKTIDIAIEAALAELGVEHRNFRTGKQRYFWNWSQRCSGARLYGRKSRWRSH